MSEEKRWYETFPDFTSDETPEEQAERLAHTIDFMNDPVLGEPAIVLMTMIHWGLKNLIKNDAPYILERSEDEPPYFQVVRDEESGYWYSELSHPGSCGVKQSVEKMIVLKELGWLEPNDDSPNWHREYSAETLVYQVAADGAEGFIKGFDKY